MRNHTPPLSQTLEKHHAASQGMRKLLYNTPAPASLYYLAPISNILGIVQSGGILSRSQAVRHTDLTPSFTRGRFSRQVQVWQDGQSQQVGLPQCANLYFNPFNPTYLFFRRRAAQLSDAIGILELDLPALQADAGLFWAYADRNLTTVGSLAVASPSTLPWQQIFMLQRIGAHTSNIHTMAECLIYRPPISGVAQPTIALPAVRRVWVLATDDPDGGAASKLSGLVTVQTFGGRRTLMPTLQPALLPPPSHRYAHIAAAAINDTTIAHRMVQRLHGEWVWLRSWAKIRLGSWLAGVTKWKPINTQTR